MAPTSRSWRLMGTVIEARIWHEEAEPILDQVENLLYLYKDRFSANDLTSELMEVNHNAGVQSVPVAEDLYELIALGKQHSCAAGSWLNITIGPLIQSWRIGFEDARLPQQEEIDRALAISNPEDIILDPSTRSVFLAKKGMAIDLGALAKGYIADQIVAYLKRVGVVQGLINLGGNVLTFGEASHNDDGLWRIGIQDPTKERGHNLAVLALPAKSVVTSGIYERTFTCEGQTYHHIFNRETGYPVETDIASLTIVSDLSVDGEIWTTRLFGMSLLDIYQAICQEEGIEGVIVTKENQYYVTPGLEDCLC